MLLLQKVLARKAVSVQQNPVTKNLSTKDATIGANVVWIHKGKTPYEATIVGIHADKGRLYISGLSLKSNTLEVMLT